MIVGAHVSTAGGLPQALINGHRIGAEALQIFPSAPLRWKINGWSNEECADFRARWPKEFQQVVFHGIYLTNLAAASERNRALTRTALIDTMSLAAKLGIVGTVIHPGSYQSEVGRDQIGELIAQVLAQTPPETKLIYENSAGGTLGGQLADLKWLLEISSDQSRVGVCLDTCHAFAAGYDLRTATGYCVYLDEVDRQIGLERVFCWHLNDSKFPLGSKRDRHENIGEGELGEEVFKELLRDPRWSKTAGYLEVPGFTNQGPDKQNVDRLKGWR